MKSRIVHAAKKVVSLVPPQAVKFIYLKILRPKPLRRIADSFIKLLIPETLRIEEGLVYIDKNDVEVSGALALGAHDPFEIELFRKELRPGMTVIDIGANIGYYTVIAAGRAGPKGRVIAYEPEEKNFAFIEKNLAENSFSWASAVKQALGDEAGKRTFFLADSHTGVHSFINNRGFSRQMEVECDTLDHSLERFGSPKVDVIKMDIEGFEIMAIEGMRRTIRRNNKLVMFVEFYPQAIERLAKKPINYLKILRDLGFSLSIIDEDAHELVPLIPRDFETFVANFPKTGEVVKNIRAVKSAK